MNYQIGALGAEAQTADFACGEPVLDQYLQRYARQDIKRSRIISSGYAVFITNVS